MEKTRRRRRSAEGWRQVLRRFAESGLTALAFCKHEGIGSKSFYRWRSRLGSSPDQPVAHEGASVTNTESGSIDLGALRSGSSRLELRLDLGGGVLLHLVRS